MGLALKQLRGSAPMLNSSLGHRTDPAGGQGRAAIALSVGPDERLVHPELLPGTQCRTRDDGLRQKKGRLVA